MDSSYAEFLARSMEWIRDSGWIGGVWFVVLFTVTSFLFLPGSVLTVGAGAIYGFWISVPLVAGSSALAAAASFLTSRYLARNWMRRKLGGDGRLQALEKAMGKEGWKMILVSRVSPIVPHTLVSYAAGLTQISFWRFFIASFIGFIPMSAAYSYVGAMVGRAVRTRASLAPHDAFTWTLYIVGLIATAIVVVWMGRVATRIWKSCITPEAKKVVPERVDVLNESDVTPTVVPRRSLSNGSHKTSAYRRRGKEGVPRGGP
jgi:uncharacterized membrane protein YdjX (TVP38/TMEM64 family)